MTFSSIGFKETTLISSALIFIFFKVLTDSLTWPNTDPWESIKISFPLVIVIFLPNLYP